MGQDRTPTGPSEYHRPVMAQEVAELLRPLQEGIVVDATFGGGGHTRTLLESTGRNMRIIGIDRDPAAREQARDLDVDVLAGDFGDLDALLDDAGVDGIDGALFDLGISSRQVDDPARGFSYHHEGPLDMRMDPEGETTAADLVNHLDVSELADLLRRFADERHAGRIARAIVDARPLRTTTELAEVVAAAVPAAARRGGHPARRTFQALRIAVNHELDSLQRGLEAAIGRLRPHGRVVVIAYHSLEDRIVKRRFAEGAAGCTCPPELPVCGCGAEPELRVLTRGAVRPAPEEIDANPRARSARLRAAEKAA